MKTPTMYWQNTANTFSKVKGGIQKLSGIILLSLFSFIPLKAQNPDCGTDFTFTNAGGMTVDFKGTSFGNAMYYFWDFGDSTGGQLGDLNISHTYQMDGIYNVCIVGYDAMGQVCMGNANYCHAVMVGNPDTSCTATAAFWAMPDGMTLYFQNNSYGNYDSQWWEFGDGANSSDFEPIHTYQVSDTFEVCLSVWNSNDTSCYHTYCNYVFTTGSPDPCANLKPYFYSYGDSGMGMYFYNATQAGATGFMWEFGDGSTSTEENPYHVYANYGFYNVCMTVTQDTCTKTWCSMVDIPNPADCHAWFGYTGGNTETELVFYNQSNGNFSNLLWTFSDGSTSSEYSPVHNFSSTGWHKVCLRVWNDTAACENEYCMDVYIGNQSTCFAEFYHEQDSSNAMGYHFKNASSGSYTNFMWDFGDGTTSYDMEPYHVYANYGEYYACLIIWDSTGNCQNQSCHSIYIMDPNGCYARFESKQDEMGLGVNFFNASMGNFTSQYWTFGDGDSSNDYSPLHQYAMEGDYEVCLHVFNDSTQCNDTYCSWIYVYNMNVGCKAYFEHWYDSTGTGVNFWNTSSGDYNEFFWTFGDGESSMDMNPHHNYPSPGTYHVCLKIANNMTGCMDEYCYDVYIYAQSTCKAYYTHSFSGSMGVQFESLATGNASGMMWDFGDGTTSDLNNPFHEFTGEGSYLVCLKLSNDSLTCYDSYCEWIYVFDPNMCNSFFGFWVDSTGKTVHFENWSNKDDGRMWNFGDGDTSSERIPVHTYTVDGSYDICLNIWSNDTCSDTYCTTVYIYDNTRCKAYFYSWGDSMGLGVNFSDNSSGEHNHNKWSFGDGTFSDDMHPHHVYANKGEYEVCLEIWNDNSNCFDKYCSMVYVHDPSSPCNAYFGYYTDEIGLTVSFMNWSKGEFSNWAWDFGDGSSSADFEPMHTYSTEGSYKVCLILKNDSTGCTDQYCMDVFVKARPECEAYYYYEQADSGLGMHFSNNSWGNFNNWMWDFGDGNTSTEEWPFHEFSTEGWYNVCLKIWSDSGSCNQTICNTLYVFDIAKLNSFYGYTPDTTGTGLVFLNWSTGVASTVLWSFGDGDTSTETSPKHEYAQFGVYNVCLTVTDTAGNSDTYCDSLAFFPVNRPAKFANTTEVIKIYPNPANPKTTIKYLLAKATKVEINIYDILSRKIATVVNANLEGGTYEYQWDATHLNTGLYFIEVKTGHSRNLYKVSVVR